MLGDLFDGALVGLIGLGTAAVVGATVATAVVASVVVASEVATASSSTAVAIVGVRVETSKVVGLTALATDGVVAAFHVGDSGVFLMAILLGATLATRVATVDEQPVRPAVLEGVHSNRRVGGGGVLRDLAVRRTRGTTAPAVDSRVSLVHALAKLSGSSLDVALFVGSREVGLEVIPRLIRNSFLVPVTNVELEDTRFRQDLVRDADQSLIGDRLATGQSDVLSDDGARPEIFHGVLGFPGSSEVKQVGFEVGAIDGAVVGFKVLEDLKRRDHVEIGDWVAERLDVLMIDGIEQLFLELALDLVANLVVMDVTIPGVGGGSDGGRRGSPVEVGLSRRTNRNLPVIAGAGAGVVVGTPRTRTECPRLP